MPYLGNAPSAAFQSVAYQDLTGGTGTSFTLSHAVSSAQEIEVFVNNVRQEPTVAYSAVGTTLTMTGTIAATDDFYVVFQGKAVGSVSHPTTSPLAATTGTFSGNVTSSGSVTATSFSGDGSALTGVSAGKVLQFASDQSANTSSSATIPQDNTAPTVTEGTEVFSIAFTPTASNSTLLIQADFQLSSSTNGRYINYALFEDSTCIGAWSDHNVASNNGLVASFNVVRSASSTTARTYSVRAGCSSGTTGTVYIGDVYNTTYGSLNANYMTIQEIEG